jgi:hypothetical protein
MPGWQVALCLLAGLAAWAGLGFLILLRPPDALAQAAFYTLFFVAVTGTAMPVVRLLHRAFPVTSGRRRGRSASLRQSIWVGLFATTVLGLRAARLRDIALIVILGTILVLLESFFQQQGR